MSGLAVDTPHSEAHKLIPIPNPTTLHCISSLYLRKLVSNRTTTMTITPIQTKTAIAFHPGQICNITNAKNHVGPTSLFITSSSNSDY